MHGPPARAADLRNLLELREGLAAGEHALRAAVSVFAQRADANRSNVAFAHRDGSSTAGPAHDSARANLWRPPSECVRCEHAGPEERPLKLGGVAAVPGGTPRGARAARSVPKPDRSYRPERPTTKNTDSMPAASRVSEPRAADPREILLLASTSHVERMDSKAPRLKFLHSASVLNHVKLSIFRRPSTDELKSSLAPCERGSLKVRHDGTVLDGHHRLSILMERGENIDRLPREIIEREDEP